MALLLLFSCKKKGSNSPGTDNTNEQFAFSVTYDTVLTMEPDFTKYFFFSVKVLGGDITSNPLTCSLEGLPPGVASASPGNFVVTNLLGGNFQVHTNSTITIGDYAFRLKVNSELYGDKYYNATLRVTSPEDYAALLAGTYDSCYDYCPDSGFYYYASQLNAIPDTPYVLKMTNIRNLGAGFVVRATIGKTVVIPVQASAGRTIWGSGSFSQDARPGHGGDYLMAINDTIVTGSDTLACTIHIEH